jgi:hypothetical protein
MDISGDVVQLMQVVGRMKGGLLAFFGKNVEKSADFCVDTGFCHNHPAMLSFFNDLHLDVATGK